MLGSWEGTKLTISVAPARNPAYLPDDSEVLISKSTWPLKLSGLLFAGLLVIGRSASYGNVTWTPAYHAADSPLVVQVAGSHKPPPASSPSVFQSAGRKKPPPAMPNLGPVVPAVMTKAAVAEESVAFHPGNS